MKAQKNTNAESIKQFLLLAPRTRKEIVKLVVCDLNKVISKDKFDTAYKTNFRGYYSDFFTACERKGNIEKKNGKWQVTESCIEEGNGLWSMNKDRKIEILSNRINRYENQVLLIRDLKRQLEEKNNENEIIIKINLDITK